MQQIEVTDAPGQLAGLIAQVEAGDEVVLTREGKVIARIVPEKLHPEQTSELTPEERARARQALADIDALATRLNWGPFNMEEFKRDRDEGRH